MTAPAAQTRPLSDESLMRRFASGGPASGAALGELAARYEAGLVGLATGLLNGRGDLARDAVQDAWVRVIRSARASGAYAGRSSVKTWLYRIVINRCLDMRDAEAGGAPPGLSFNGRVGSNAPVGDAEELAALRRSVAALPPDRRVILLLCYHQGISHARAAEILGIPVGTLKSRLHAAVGELRACLQREDQR